MRPGGTADKGVRGMVRQQRPLATKDKEAERKKIEVGAYSFFSTSSFLLLQILDSLTTATAVVSTTITLMTTISMIIWQRFDANLDKSDLTTTATGVHDVYENVHEHVHEQVHVHEYGLEHVHGQVHVDSNGTSGSGQGAGTTGEMLRPGQLTPALLVEEKVKVTVLLWRKLRRQCDRLWSGSRRVPMEGDGVLVLMKEAEAPLVEETPTPFKEVNAPASLF